MIQDEIAELKHKTRVVLSEHLHTQGIISDMERDPVAEKLYSAYLAFSDAQQLLKRMTG